MDNKLSDKKQTKKLDFEKMINYILQLDKSFREWGYIP